MISFLPNKTVALTMKDDYSLSEFVKTLLNSGYTVSQNQSHKDGYVQIYVSYDASRQKEAPLKRFVDFVKRNLEEFIWILIDVFLLIYVWVFGSNLPFKIIYSFVGLLLLIMNTYPIIKAEKSIKNHSKSTIKEEDK